MLLTSFLDAYDCAAHPTASNCSQICDVTDGNYSCSCHPGYLLNSDRMSCHGKLLNTISVRVILGKHLNIQNENIQGQIFAILNFIKTGFAFRVGVLQTQQ